MNNNKSYVNNEFCPPLKCMQQKKKRKRKKRKEKANAKLVDPIHAKFGFPSRSKTKIRPNNPKMKWLHSHDS